MSEALVLALLMLGGWKVLITYLPERIPRYQLRYEIELVLRATDKKV